ncbi:hypothetical protein GCM10022393_42350 [Aquimarina addita]|uniref:Tetratricopeptide repeat protein n=2 Tax=Aquimarina addita TaxID=870485 RepID=A0ABP6UXN4_9FLAO
MERQRFPNIIELLSGNFLRHSQEYHFWRIKDREEKLQTNSDSLSLMDDLAVSYSKTGNDKQAIKIGHSQLLIQPNRYETLANLGTFYIHNGDLASGITYIDRAIDVNPNAHFGREIYQRHLAAYVFSKKVNGKIPLPLASKFQKNPEALPNPKQLDNFYTFLLNKHLDTINSIEDEKFEIPSDKRSNMLPHKKLKEAIIGIMGMMKFGNTDSPILAEVLGDLLMATGWKDGARQLAARAYLKASYDCKNKQAEKVYRKRVEYVLFHQYTKKRGSQFTIKDLEAMYQEERILGQKFFNRIKNDEIKWIAQGKQPEIEFGKKYYSEPVLGERIQKASAKWRNNHEYLTDTLVGTTVNYRTENKNNKISNAKAKETVDSLLHNNQSIPVKNPKVMPKSSNSWFFYVIGIILLIGLSVAIRKKLK